MPTLPKQFLVLGRIRPKVLDPCGSDIGSMYNTGCKIQDAVLDIRDWKTRLSKKLRLTL